MVYPDVARSLDADPVSVGSKDFLADNIADNDILGLSNEKSNADKFWILLINFSTSEAWRASYWSL